jgi:hypothetical protein
MEHDLQLQLDICNILNPHQALLQNGFTRAFLASGLLHAQACGAELTPAQHLPQVIVFCDIVGVYAP